MFVGNLSYTADQNEVTNMFASKGIRPVSVRVLMDDFGKSKGSAFVDLNPLFVLCALEVDRKEFQEKMCAKC